MNINKGTILELNNVLHKLDLKHKKKHCIKVYFPVIFFFFTIVTIMWFNTAVFLLYFFYTLYYWS